MSDRTVRLVLTGSAASAIAALDAVGIKAKETAATTESAFGEKTAAGVNGFVGRLANLTQGIPVVGSFFEKSAEKIGEADTKGQKFAATMGTLGKAALFGAGAGLAAAAGESLKLAANFQQSMANMAAQAGIPVAAANKIGQAFLSTAGTTTFSAQEIAAAYGPVAGQLGEVAGHALSAKEALTVMKAATDLAESSGTSLDVSTKALASTMQAYRIGVSGASGASNVLFNTARLTGNGVDAVAQAAGRLKMRLGDAAPSLGQVGGLMVEFAQNGVVGSRSVNMVGSALAGLVYPSSTATKALDQMGVKLTDSQGKFIGLGPALDRLKAGFMTLPGATQAAAAAQQLAADKATLARLALEKQTPAVKAQVLAIKQHDLALTAQAAQLSSTDAAQKLFGKNAATLMPIVMAGSSALNAQASSVSKLGSAHEAAEKQTATFQGTVEKLKATGEDLGVRFGQLLLPVITRLGQIVAQVTGFFLTHRTAAIALGVVIGGILLAATVAWTVSLFAAGGALAFLMSPITLIVAGIALLVLGIVELVDHWTQVWALIKKYSVEIAAAIALLLGPIGWVIAAALLLVTHWKQVFDFVKAAPGEAWRWIDSNFVQPVERFFEAIPDWIRSHWQLILAILTGPIGLAVSWITGHFQKVIDFFTSIPSKMAALGAHMWDWISGGFKMVIDQIIIWWNEFVGLLKIPGFKIGVGPIHYTFGGVDIGSSLKIPLLDTGGLVSSPTLAALAGNSVPEIVSPVPQLRQVIAEAMNGAGGGEPVQLILDGRVIGQLLFPHIRKAGLQGTARNSVKVGLA